MNRIEELTKWLQDSASRFLKLQMWDDAIFGNGYKNGFWPDHLKPYSVFDERNENNTDKDFLWCYSFVVGVLDCHSRQKITKREGTQS